MDRMELDINPQVDMNINGGVTDLYNYLKDYTTVVLQPNRVGNRNILTQEMVAGENIKYIIKYNYNLDGKNIVFNANTIIEIDGGSLTNGGIVGNNTFLINRNELPEEEILINVVKSGTWRSTTTDEIQNVTKHKVYLTSDSDGILTQDMINEPNTIYVIKDNLVLDEDITIPANCVLEFDGGSISGNGTGKDTITGNSCLLSGNPDIRCTINNIMNNTTHLSWFLKESDKNVAFNRAITCAGNTILDGDNIPINLSGTITFDYSKRCDLKNLVINYTATSNGESMFLFDSDTRWSQGGNIHDCKFTMTNPDSYKNVHCIHYRRWDNTTKGIIDNVEVIDFTGYMFLCESYLQEFSFERFKGFNVGGFISFNKEYNTNNAFGDYGVGGSNILSFYQCGIDTPGLNINNTITDIVDLTRVINATFINCVWQGVPNAGVNGMNITSYDQTYSPEVVMINCWFEFTNPFVLTNNTIKIGEKVILRVNNMLAHRFHFVGIDTALYLSLNNMVEDPEHDIYQVSELFLIENGTFPKIVIDGTVNSLNIPGILSLYKNKADISINTGSWFGNHVNYSEGSHVDMLPHIEKIMKDAYPTYSYNYHYENGIKFLRINIPDSYDYSFFRFFTSEFESFVVPKKQTFYRFVYRVVPKETITSANINKYKGVLTYTNYLDNPIDSSQYAVYLGQDNDPDNAEWHEAIMCPQSFTSTIPSELHYNASVMFDIAVCEIFQGNIPIDYSVSIDPSDNKKLLGGVKVENLIGDVRPIGVNIGFCMFDVTVGKPIWWNGTEWVDAMGNDITTDYVQKSATAGLLKNDGTVDTSTYLSKSGTLVSGNVPEFDGTDGAVKDSGKAATNIP